MSLLQRAVLPLCAMVFLSPVYTHAASTFMPDFASAEHVFFGDKVKLPTTNPGQPFIKLHLPNGLNLTYGEILSFGDFYGVVDYPISQGKTEQERRDRFIAAFNSFSETPTIISEATQILAVIHDEQKMVEEALKKGEPTEELYKKLGHDNDIKFNCITGGYCDPKTWFLPPWGRYLSLANDDFDHFGENAWVTYKTGHELALEQAVLAHETHDLKKLELAYALNAFACHFLSDRFASGHIRTPRQELTDHVTPGTIGSLLASFMHEEENFNGLRVHNVRGDQWIAYGDKSYFNPKNNKHKDLLEETLQASANQIFAAFQQGTTQIYDNIYTLIPQPDEIENTGKLDISPLFYWDSKSSQLMLRNDTTNLYDRHWTSAWWGWSTLIKLQSERGGLSEKTQATLALAGLGEQALQNGLITNKEIATYIKKKHSA